MLEKKNNQVGQLNSRRCWNWFNNRIIKKNFYLIGLVGLWIGTEWENTETNSSQFGNLPYNKVSIFSVDRRWF